jgi:ADP-ribose pyrophosphatase YjhB (NUDIX family)
MFVNSAGGWIEDAEGRVLLHKTSESREEWSLPGGIMQLGEAAHETAIREVREETGLETTVLSLIGIYSKYVVTLDNGHQCQSIATIFRMQITGGSMIGRSEETYDLRFFPRSDIPPLVNRQQIDIVADVLSGTVPAYR